ncbi:hypothetical protein ACI65C_005195 [Semiaphis heraclei]
MSTKLSDNGVVEPISSKKKEMQQYLPPCEAYKIDRKDDNETQKSMITDESSKHQQRSDLDNYKLQQKICKLDKLGKSIQSLPGKRVLDKNTYSRLKNAAVVVTAKERRMAIEQHITNEERLKAESEARKEQLQKLNMFHTKGPKLAQLDEEANKKTNYLLNRAYELRQEQEYEIKQCNSLILSTKCHAIRCAQIEEKELIKKQMKQEQRRSEEIMEQQRLLAAKKYEKAVEADRLKKKLQATEIVQQMKENEITREWEAAIASEDARVRTEAAIEAQRAEVIDYKNKLITQAEMRKEFLQINAQLKDLKSIEKELVKMEILQIQEYDRKKNEREMAYEEEMKKLKMSKEKQIAKIQASQKASQDFQAAKDELNALRTQDKVEREWRRKEREEAIKKIKQNEDLKEARRQQIEGQRECYAFEIQREKEEFDKIIKLNVEELERTKEFDRQTKLKLDEHRRNLLKQISEKEVERIKDRKEFFQEGIIFQQTESAREKSLRNTMKKKIEGLRQLLNHIKIIHKEQNDKIFFTNLTVIMNKDLTKVISNVHKNQRIKDYGQYFKDIVLDKMPNKTINEFLGDKLKMKYFVTIFMVFQISLILQQSTSTASPLDNYLDKDPLEENGVELLTDIEDYMDKDAEDNELILADVQKRKLSGHKIFRRYCVPRGGNCDHRPKYCCNSSSCRCNLWGSNCKCQRMGFFQWWGK